MGEEVLSILASFSWISTTETALPSRARLPRRRGAGAASPPSSPPSPARAAPSKACSAPGSHPPRPAKAPVAPAPQGAGARPRPRRALRGRPRATTPPSSSARASRTVLSLVAGRPRTARRRQHSRPAVSPPRPAPRHRPPPHRRRPRRRGPGAPRPGSKPGRWHRVSPPSSSCPGTATSTTTSRPSGRGRWPRGSPRSSASGPGHERPRRRAAGATGRGKCHTQPMRFFNRRAGTPGRPLRRPVA